MRSTACMALFLIPFTCSGAVNLAYRGKVPDPKVDNLVRFQYEVTITPSDSSSASQSQSLYIRFPRCSAIGVDEKPEGLSYSLSKDGDFCLIKFDPAEKVEQAKPGEESSKASETSTQNKVQLFYRFEESEIAEGTIVYKTASAGPESAIEGPVPAYDPNFVQPVFGVGFTRLFDDPIDWEERDEHIFIKNDSSNRASGYGGLRFLLPSPWAEASDGLWKLSAFSAINFEQGGTSTVNGFTLGAGIGLNRYLSLYIGFTSAKGEELSHGFQAAVSDLSASATCADKVPSRYCGVALESGRKRFLEEKDYDGFPLSAIRPADGAMGGMPAPGNTFSGNPIVQSYNKRITFGIMIPFDLRFGPGE